MLKFLKEYAVMTLGLAVFVFGWVAFLNPHEITGGGIAGLASVIHYGIPAIPVSYAKFVIDALLLVFGFIVLGRGFGIKTIYCVIASFFLFHFMPRIPGLIDFFSGIEENIINALIGGALSGTGIAIILTKAAVRVVRISLQWPSISTKTFHRAASTWYATRWSSYPSCCFRTKVCRMWFMATLKSSPFPMRLICY